MNKPIDLSSLIPPLENAHETQLPTYLDPPGRIAQLEAQVANLIIENKQLQEMDNAKALMAIRIDRDQYRNAFTDLISQFAEREPHDTPHSVAHQLSKYFATLIQNAYWTLETVDKAGTLNGYVQVRRDDFDDLRKAVGGFAHILPVHEEHVPTPSVNQTMNEANERIREAVAANREADAARKAERESVSR